ARTLASRGARAIALVDLTESVHDSAAELNGELGSTVAAAHQGDVTNSDFRQQVFTETTKLGTPRICIPAAGILRDAMAVKIDKETGKSELYSESMFRQVLEVNLLHPTYWCMQMMAGIAEQRATEKLGKWKGSEDIQGVAVIIGSVASRGNRGQVSYSSAKSGLSAVAKTLNAEGAYHGVQTKIIHPGFVETPMVELLPDGMFEQQLKQLVPIDRMIKPEEIASTIAHMIENPIISGPIWADGGLPPFS
ncbi:MAG: SDR family oxidoreductase, partial [bacterium]